MIKVIGHLWQVKAEIVGKIFGDHLTQLCFRNMESKEKGIKLAEIGNRDKLDVKSRFPIFF